MSNIELEIWKDIEEYNGLYFEKGQYQVSNMGRVRDKEKRIKKLTNDGRGYLVTKLSNNKKSKTAKVHQLVAKAFCKNDNPQEKTVINHINEIRNDNRAENLEWVTPQENTIHSRQSISKTRKGKCTNKIYCIELDRIFESQKELADFLGYGEAYISSCILNNKTIKGYTLKKIEEKKEINQIEIYGTLKSNNGLSVKEIQELFNKFLNDNNLNFE